jgi:NAD(P)-dependent dehydrogenase (short-subunit alcohol dehydrogenase family)
MRRPSRILPPDFVQHLYRLDGRTAVVTGGASGLGAAVAAGLAQAGAHVIVLDIAEDAAAGVAHEINDHHGTAEPFACDVTDSATMADAAAEIEANRHSVDILVNSAGSAFRSPAETFPEDEFDRIIALNLKGTFLACQSFGRAMLKRESGSIVNVASIGGLIAYPHASAYLASKGGVVQLTRALALEWIGKVRVNALAPTLFDTPLTDAGAQRSSVTSDFIRGRFLRHDRLGQPSELVGAALFLASEASALVTGHTLPVDDGYLIA